MVLVPGVSYVGNLGRFGPKLMVRPLFSGAGAFFHSEGRGVGQISILLGKGVQSIDLDETNTAMLFVLISARENLVAQNRQNCRFMTRATVLILRSQGS